MDINKLAHALAKILDVKDPVFQQLISIIERSHHAQVKNLTYFLHKNVTWQDNADDADIKELTDAVLELKQSATPVEEQVLATLLNNLPYKTNLDVAQAQARVNVANMGLKVNKLVQAKQAEIVQQVTKLTGSGLGGYNKQLGRRALYRVAAQNEPENTSLDLIFKNANNLAIDLDNIIKFQMQNHVNPNSISKIVAKELGVAGKPNPNEDLWETTMQKRYMSTKADMERILVTESKATQTQECAKQYSNLGFTKLKIVTRDNPHVCRYCEGHDGTIVEIKDAVVGMNVPPFHPRCHCNVIPVQMDYKDVLNELD
ncbi:minor capsid protein [Lactiplantibacillus plantarum]|uniref:minor capsid protein n=1 Tax=Lactiplantibacillus plantarum TaxID=1590 RepID=UPI002238B13E|nr:minor capsid protein [Lactiplantibacillus plantarum]MCG0895001.1 phage head morphogenesis protein [Lactiplantibacillus plantarum]MCW6174150.1 minor capsid protein [Lactiplantibacillus plantarum]